MMKINRTLVFDMDKTIADLYEVEGWLDDLRAENTRPYEVAKNIYDEDIINPILGLLKAIGYRVVVTTWLAKDSSTEYEKEVARVKKEWLDRHEFPYDEFYPLSYGIDKSLATKNLGGVQILFDDDPNVRRMWTNGFTVNANNNIIPFLSDLLLKSL